jgi:uncharacterized protein DUF4912
MERDDYTKLTVSELRTEAKRRGLKGVDRLRREQLIERLSEAPAKAEPKGLVSKARNLVKRVTEKVTPKPTVQENEESETLETETMARLYEEQGHVTQALVIYRRILDENPARTDLKERIDSLERRAAPPVPPQEIPPGQRQSMAPPSEPFGMLDFEELPEIYGIDDCAVVPRDPWNLFVYWEVTPDGRAGARSRLGGEGHAARLVLRLYSVGVGEGGVAHEERDVDLDWDHGRRVIPPPRPGVRVSVAIGLRAPSGAFAPIVHSATVLVPPAEPYPEGPVEWMEVLPNRRRGAEFEPIVVVTRGRPGEPPVRLRQGEPEVIGTPSSPWLRWPGSSEPKKYGDRR